MAALLHNARKFCAITSRVAAVRASPAEREGRSYKGGAILRRAMRLHFNRLDDQVAEGDPGLANANGFVAIVRSLEELLGEGADDCDRATGRAACWRVDSATSQ